MSVCWEPFMSEVCKELWFCQYKCIELCQKRFLQPQNKRRTGDYLCFFYRQAFIGICRLPQRTTGYFHSKLKIPIIYLYKRWFLLIYTN